MTKDSTVWLSDPYQRDYFHEQREVQRTRARELQHLRALGVRGPGAAERLRLAWRVFRDPAAAGLEGVAYAAEHRLAAD